MIKIGDYEKIMSDRNIFSQIVYTPLSEAIQLLEKRRKNSKLKSKVEKLLKGDIPECFRKDKEYAVLFRQVATPNYETKRFIALAKKNNLHPVICEYYDDKFAPENDFKYSLGKLTLFCGIGKHGGLKREFFNIINFNESNGKKLKEIKTLWNEPLIDFHKKLFSVCNYSLNDFHAYDASNWYKNNGGKAVKYYTNFFLLFVSSGILFENFLTIKNTEGDFTKNIVLPSLEKAINLVGVKPLIVPLEPVDTETDEYWYYYNDKIKKVIELLLAPFARGVKHKKNEFDPRVKSVITSNKEEK